MTTMPPRLRKLALVAHITASIGWLGAVAAFLVLALVGLNGDDGQQVRGAYLSMDLIARWIIVPLSLAALATGLIQSLGTNWGLFRHYWILMKLLITVLSTFILQIHVEPIALLGDAAAEDEIGPDEHREARLQLVVAAVAALAALIVNVTLAVYKPRGLTPYGWRRLDERRALLRP